MRMSAFTRASLPVMLTATRSAWNSIWRANAKWKRLMRWNRSASTIRKTQMTPDSNQAQMLIRKSSTPFQFSSYSSQASSSKTIPAMTRLAMLTY